RRPLGLVHHTAMAIAAIGEVPRPWRMLLDDRLLTAISLIPPHPGLLPMQQIRQHRAVGNIGRRRYHRMDQLAAAVDPKMSLHPKIPLLALLGLMHLGIARLPGILGRRGRIDDRRIDSCRWPPSVPAPPGAVAPHQTTA